MQIIPSILTDNPKKLSDVISKLNNVILPNGFPLERIQIDINDGTFLDVKTTAPETFANLNCAQKLDFHLMVSDPIDWVDRCVRVKGDRVIGQIEHMSDQSAFIRRILELGIKAGLAVDIETELLRIDPNVIRNLEILILMTYPAGKGGQDMNEGIYDKIEQLKEIKLKGGYNFNICLDGGITLDNIKRVKLTGIDEVAIGNRIIDGDIEENLEEFYKAMY